MAVEQFDNMLVVCLNLSFFTNNIASFNFILKRQIVEEVPVVFVERVDLHKEENRALNCCTERLKSHCKFVIISLTPQFTSDKQSAARRHRKNFILKEVNTKITWREENELEVATSKKRLRTTPRFWWILKQMRTKLLIKGKRKRKKKKTFTHVTKS